jgi:hypothetical protein
MIAAFVLSFISAGFAFGAATFWLFAAIGKVPPMVAYWDSTPETDPFLQTFVRRVRLNKVAATLAALSAVTMGASLVLQALALTR